MTKIRTGSVAPKSGQYVYGTGKNRAEITLSKGERVPPTRNHGATTFTLIDKTKHKGDK